MQQNNLSSPSKSSQSKIISFVSPYVSEKTLDYLKKALEMQALQGDGYFTKECHQLLEKQTQSLKALLTHSGTGALEMACLLVDIKEGDEVIMPSYTFSSTANAVALRGGVPIFIDIREDTLNINEELIEQAITQKTRAILVVHYAGVAADMDRINQIAKKYNLVVIEDAAQGVGAFYKGKPLGTLSSLGAYSFHATKNIISGEGGALLINNLQFIERAEIIREKGTNRSQFLRGEVDKYTWQDIGSSFLPSDLIAALLLSQLEEVKSINQKRIDIWNHYQEEFLELEEENFLKRPFVPSNCSHNAHIYYLILNTPEIRNEFINYMKSRNIQCTSHYVPLHSAPAGRKYGKNMGSMEVTDKIAQQIVRLPLWPHLSYKDLKVIIEATKLYFRS